MVVNLDETIGWDRSAGYGVGGGTGYDGYVSGQGCTGWWAGNDGPAPV